MTQLDPIPNNLRALMLMPKSQAPDAVVRGKNRSADYDKGSISFHGQIIAVIDLAQVLGFPSEKIGKRLIVLVNQQQPVALGVGQVNKIINIETKKTQRMENYAEKNYITEIVQHGGKMINLFDLAQLQHQLAPLCSATGGNIA